MKKLRLFILSVGLTVGLNGFAQSKFLDGVEIQRDSLMTSGVQLLSKDNLADFKKSDAVSSIDETRIGFDVTGSFNAIASSNLSQGIQPAGSAGFFINRKLGKTLFETGLRYNWRQYELTGFIPQYAPGISQVDLQTNSLELPIMLGRMVQDFGIISPTVHYVFKFGMYMSVGMFGSGTIRQANADGTFTLVDIDNVYKKQEGFDPLRRFDIGGRVAVEVYVANRWKIGLSYTRGWLDIQPTLDRHMKTKSFDISVGYVFKYKRR